MAWGPVTLLPSVCPLPSVGLVSPSGGKDSLAAVGLCGPSTGQSPGVHARSLKRMPALSGRGRCLPRQLVELSRWDSLIAQRRSAETQGVGLRG